MRLVSSRAAKWAVATQHSTIWLQRTIEYQSRPEWSALAKLMSYTSTMPWASPVRCTARGSCQQNGVFSKQVKAQGLAVVLCTPSCCWLGQPEACCGIQTSP